MGYARPWYIRDLVATGVCKGDWCVFSEIQEETLFSFFLFWSWHTGICLSDIFLYGAFVESVSDMWFVLLTGKQLRVYSLSTSKKKCLSEHCVGGFTTAPDKLCLYLYEININLADTFPCKVMVHHELTAKQSGGRGGLISKGSLLSWSYCEGLRSLFPVGIDIIFWLEWECAQRFARCCGHP